jgi:calcineurin-like phosphoesterase family protein
MTVSLKKSFQDNYEKWIEIVHKDNDLIIDHYKDDPESHITPINKTRFIFEVGLACISAIVCYVKGHAYAIEDTERKVSMCSRCGTVLQER